MLQIVGIILAFQTRKVRIKGLRDSKYVTALVYISSIVLVILALITFSLRTYVNISAGIIAGVIVILTTVFLALIFVPKVGVCSHYNARITNNFSIKCHWHFVTAELHIFL